ncbi:MAG: hypothetical protein ACYDBB_17690 [Armatimonadota bacterium]
MARRCSVCIHTESADIDQALVRGVACGALAAKHHLSEDALQRHKDHHLPASVRTAQDAADVTQALSVVAQLREINAASLAILHEAHESGQPQLALRAVDRIHKQVELQAKLLGDLDERPSVTVTFSAEWVSLRTTILQALDPFPDARLALATALAEVER